MQTVAGLAVLSLLLLADGSAVASRSAASPFIVKSAAADAPAGAAANWSIVAHRVLLTEAAAQHGAVAIDGSPGSYHIATAPAGSPNASKWHLHLQGGGWCWGVADCAGRALGSKVGTPPPQLDSLGNL